MTSVLIESIGMVESRLKVGGVIPPFLKRNVSPECDYHVQQR
jgi:hypothetical protein